MHIKYMEKYSRFHVIWNNFPKFVAYNIQSLEASKICLHLFIHWFVYMVMCVSMARIVIMHSLVMYMGLFMTSLNVQLYVCFDNMV